MKNKPKPEPAPVTYRSFTLVELEAYARLNSSLIPIDSVLLTKAIHKLQSTGLLVTADTAPLSKADVKRALAYIERTGKPYPTKVNYVANDTALLCALKAVIEAALWLRRVPADAGVVRSALKISKPMPVVQVSIAAPNAQNIPRASVLKKVKRK